MTCYSTITIRKSYLILRRDKAACHLKTNAPVWTRRVWFLRWWRVCLNRFSLNLLLWMRFALPASVTVNVALPAYASLSTYASVTTSAAINISCSTLLRHWRTVRRCTSIPSLRISSASLRPLYMSRSALLVLLPWSLITLTLHGLSSRDCSWCF